MPKEIKIDVDKITSPAFVLQEDLLIQNLEKLQYFQKQAGISIICALKGYAFHATFPLLKKYLSGATASSLHEAKLVYEEMKTKPHTYCAVYIPKDFQEISKISSHLTFNSMSEWERYKNNIPNGVKCGLRVNPGYSEIQTELYNPASPNSRLGIEASLLPKNLPKGITGLHFHAMCENDANTLENVLTSFSKLYHHQIQQAEWLNFGGGHLITNENYNVEYGINVIQNFKQKYPNIKEIILEPGSAIGWETGYLVATILDIVENGNIKTAMLDVSFTCHMPDCLEMPYQPKIYGSVKQPKHKYRMGGLSCLAGDVMGDWYFNDALHVGQKIIFLDMIHYTMVKTTTFNGINLPDIGIWKDDQYQIINQFGFQDYKNRLS
ncbi:MAG: carboxynorspermidine decarboxylase [Sphingobacteriales bacterium]|nr:MAG: carboxynorspermidine decarboxylase [Sphingobacteriales bacterium]